MKSSIKASNLQAYAVGVSLNSGFLNFYSGDEPGSADIELAQGVTLLASLRFNEKAFKDAKNGTIVANGLVRDENAANTGTATFFRALNKNAEPMFQGTILAENASKAEKAKVDMVMDSTAIVQGGIVGVESFEYTCL